MQSKSKSASQMEVNAYNTSSPATCSEPWRRSMDYNSIPATEIGGNTSNSSLLEQSKDCQSQSDDGRDEEDDGAIKESQITASPHSGIFQTRPLLWMGVYYIPDERCKS